MKQAARLGIVIAIVLCVCGAHACAEGAERKLGPGWEKVVAGGSQTFGIRADGTLWSWGWNWANQLGYPTSESDTCPHTFIVDAPCNPSPKQVGTEHTWADVVVGQSHALALMDKPGLWGWGWNYAGQLTSALPAEVASPENLGGAVRWVAAATWFHSFAIRDDGTLWSWSDNQHGQVGIGFSSIKIAVLTQVGAGTKWKSVAAGSDFSIGMDQDGALWAWGNNDYGQLGLGDRATRMSPTRMKSGSDWVAVAAGGNFGLAIRKDGTLWAWGGNDFGQLGMGNLSTRLIPTQVGNSHAWSQVTVGWYHVVALQSNGTLWTWGSDSHGQLGAGSSSPSDCYTAPCGLKPLEIGKVSIWTHIAAGYSHSAAIRQDGTLWTWGSNDHGQLGLGDLKDRASPEQVP